MLIQPVVYERFKPLGENAPVALHKLAAHIHYAYLGEHRLRMCAFKELVQGIAAFQCLGIRLQGGCRRAQE